MELNSIFSLFANAKHGDRRSLAKLLTKIENGEEIDIPTTKAAWVLGVTGPPGAGKSTLIDRLASYWSENRQRVAILAVDPSSPISGGALLGDRARMVHSNPAQVFFRSISARGNHGGIPNGLEHMIQTLSELGWDRIIIETVGVGQGEFAVISVADRILLVDGPDRGDVLQAEKAGILEIADLIACNKSDLPGSLAAMKSIEDGLSYSENPPPVIGVSSLTGDGIENLIHRIETMEPDLAKSTARAKISLECSMISRIRKSPLYDDVVNDISKNKITSKEGAERLEEYYGRL
ncbi:MAG: GTP-binding protein [Candidatus Thalassarchaeaceae archaeon]|nr:GTP-binding protein [Candidatus Thalassarchaeaceae archaeon]